MTAHGARAARRAAASLIAIALLGAAVGACAEQATSTGGYGSTAPPAAYGSDPYHYRCAGACRNAG
jgi:hypothetical protein